MILDRLIGWRTFDCSKSSVPWSAVSTTGHVSQVVKEDFNLVRGVLPYVTLSHVFFFLVPAQWLSLIHI